MIEKISDNFEAKETKAKSMRERVLEEMEEFRIKHSEDHNLTPSQWRANYLNNFGYKILWQKEQLEEAGLLDKRIYGENSSDRAKNQTCREFYEDIEATMKEMGLDPEQLRELEQECRLDPKRDFNPWVDKVLDLYIRLREKGYNQRDLC